MAGAGTFTLSVLYVIRPAQASGPSSNRVLNYQLRLTDPSGIPVADGTRNIKISFYNDPTLSVVPTNFLHTDCGTPASPVGRKVVFTNGIGTVLIGDTAASGTTNCSNAAAPNALPASLFNTTTLYLGITIDSEISEMTPRKRIVATGYSLNADMLDDLDSSAVGGSIAFVPVTDSSGNLTLTKNLTIDGTTLFVDSTNDRVGIGTATPAFKFDVVGGTLPTFNDRVLKVTATLPTGATSSPFAAQMDFTSGSGSSFSQSGLFINYVDGGLGATAQWSRALVVGNSVISTLGFNPGTFSGKPGIFTDASGASVDNLGIYANAGGATSRNIAGHFRATAGGATGNIGVSGYAFGATTNNIGGYFALDGYGGGHNASSALIADNGSSAGGSIFLGRDNGTTVFSIIDGGNVGIGTTTPGERLEVVGNIVSKGTEWASRTSAADNAWRAIAYGNGLFVAVSGTGTGNRVMTSPDGITWTLRTSAADNSWFGLTYGNGLFVAVSDSGAGNRVMTSPNGITWTSRTTPTSPEEKSWLSVTYGNGLFVAVAATGTGNRVMTSPDGITWTYRTSTADNFWRDVAYGNGLFVAVADTGTGNRVMTSGKTDYIPFSANNTYQGGMNIFGNVGIDTSSPITQLHVPGKIPTSAAGSVATATGPISVTVKGRYAYVVNTTAATLQVFDVSNATAPVSVGSVATGTDPVGVSVQGRYAYVTNFTSNTLQIFDISNPASPVSVGTVASGTGPSYLYVQGRYAYTANYTANTLQIFDVSNPASPVSVGSVAAGTNPQFVDVQGRYAYVTNFGSNTLQVFDVSNPASPVSVGSVATGTGPSGVYVQGRYAYVANYNSNTLQIFSIANPGSPVSVGTVATGANPHSVFVQGRYAYVNNYIGNTFQAFDVSNPASPVSVGSVATGTNPYGIHVQGRHAFVVNLVSNTLQVFDLGGSYVQQVEAGGIETGTLSVRNNLHAIDASFSGGVSIGQSLNVSGGVTFGGALTASGHLLPSVDDTYDLGSSSKRWRDLYLGPTSLHFSTTAGETATARDWKIGIDETNGATDGNLRFMEGSNQYVTVTPSGFVGIGTTSPTTALDVRGGIASIGGVSSTVLAPPSAPTVTPQGTTGSATYQYKITVRSTVGESVLSAGGTTNTGNATLTGANFNRITWTAVIGAVDYRIYRTTVIGGSPSTLGLIGTVAATSTLQFDDTGIAPTDNLPTIDTSSALGIGTTTPRELLTLGHGASLLFDNGYLASPLFGVGVGTNFMAYSEALDNAAWTKTGVTVTANTETGPGGGSGADRINAGGSASDGVSQTATNGPGFTASQTYGASVWMRVTSGTAVVSIKIASSNETSPGSPKTVTTSWQRFSTQYTFTGSSSGNPALVINNGTNAVVVWGAQLAYSQGQLPGPYVRTDSNIVRETAPRGVFIGGTGPHIIGGGDLWIGDVGNGLGVTNGKLAVRQDAADDILNLYDGSTKVFRVVDGGNVGIGTAANPSTTLDVEMSVASGGIDINNTATDGDPRIAFQLNNGTIFTMGVDDSDSDKFKIGTSAIDTNTRVTIDSTGNVGIGTSTPNNKLQVLGLLNFDDADSGTYLGFQAGNADPSGDNNTFTGYQAGFTNTTGSLNTAIGRGALYTNSTTDSSTAVGAYALYSNTATQNSALGNVALYANSSGQQNAAFGWAALTANTTGGSNTGIGSASLFNNLTGAQNTGLGYRSLYNTDANSNTGIGYQAGDTITTGTLNTFLGHNADASVNSLTNATAIGAGAVVSASNSLVLGNNANVGIGTTTPIGKLTVAGGGIAAETLTLSSAFGSVLGAATGFSGYTNLSGGIGSGGVDSITPALRLTSAGNLVNIGSVQAGGMNLTKGGTFAAKVDYTTGSSPRGIALGDVNGDGKADMAVANGSSTTVSVFINNGNGTFATKVDYTTGTTPYTVALGDVNGDGKADMVVTNGGSASASVFINSGTGTFAAKVDYTTGATPYGVALGDVNGDGKADIVVANNGSGTASVLINNGNGTFAAKVDYTAGTTPFFIALADVNGDGRADMAVANNGSTSASVFINNGNGTFATKVDYTTGANPVGIALGDVSGDGKADMVVANNGTTTASVFINNGNGTFAAKVDYTTASSPPGIALGDVNGDGKADMVTANGGSASASVFINNGSGTFAAKVDYTTGSSPFGIALGDVNGDGKADMVVANFGSTTASVLMNNASSIFFADASTGNVGIGDTTPANLLTVGNNDRFQVNSFGDAISDFTTTYALDGAATDPTSAGSGTSLPVTSATNYTIGNYIKLVNPTTSCQGSITTCYAKITNVAGNTLTISPSLAWDDTSTVTEWHVPEIGATNVASPPLENRFGRGYFIDGIVVGNATTYITDGGITSAGNFTITPGSGSTVTISGNVSQTPPNLTTNGQAGNILNATISGSAAASTYYGNKLTVANNQTTNADTVYGSHISFTDTGSLANTLTGLYVDATTANTADTTYAAVFQGGNVGIGTASPAEELTVSTSQNTNTVVRVQNANSGTDATAQFQVMNDLGNLGLLIAGSSNTQIGFEAHKNRISVDSFSMAGVSLTARGSGDIRLFTGGPADANERLRVTNSGNVGIGVTGPNEQLEIAGNFRLPTTTATTGIIKAGSSRFIHNFGTSNVFLGINAGNLTLTGASNAIVGAGAGVALTSGGFNTALGASALSSETSGANNVAVGQNALLNFVTGDHNVAIGLEALKGTASTSTGDNNIAIGSYTLGKNTTGGANVGVGYGALFNATTASNNVAVGANALFNTSTGQQNTAMGHQAANNNTTSSEITAFGYWALRSVTGTGNTALGFQAGEAGTGVGSGTYNTFIGHNSGTDSATRAYSTAIGYNARTGADYAIVLGDSTSGLYKVGIGDSTPDAKLDVLMGAATVAIFDRTTDDGTIISLQQDSIEEGTISVSGNTISYNAFTGSHYAWTEEEIDKGMLVTLTGENRRLHDLGDSEILYGVAPSSTRNDPRILGAYLSLQEPNEPASDENPHLVMAVGNGDLWVVDEGQDISIGDYLIASDTAGHAMRDPETDRVSHIVARAAETVVWDGVSDTVDGKKRKRISVTFANFDRRNVEEGFFASKISDLTVEGALDFKGYGIENLAFLRGVGGSWSLDEGGKLVIRDVDAKNVKAETVTIKNGGTQKTAGTGMIRAGAVGELVINPLIDGSSIVVLTFEGDAGSRWWISEKENGKLMVNLSSPAIADTKFSYWIVGVEGGEEPAPAPAEPPPETPEEQPPAEEPEILPPAVENGAEESQE